MPYSKLKHKITVRKSGGSMPLYIIRDIIQKAVKATLNNEEVDTVCEANVLVTNDKGIRKYNCDYRGIDKATDVLSFPMQTFSKAGWSSISEPEPDRDTGYIPLGDIVASSETIKKHSDEYGKSIFDEWAYMIIHSTLHLLGYDHDNDHNEKAMFGKSDQIMQKMGINVNDK